MTLKEWRTYMRKTKGHKVFSTYPLFALLDYVDALEEAVNIALQTKWGNHYAENQLRTALAKGEVEI